jgi:hypothetical protein
MAKSFVFNLKKAKGCRKSWHVFFISFLPQDPDPQTPIESGSNQFLGAN